MKDMISLKISDFIFSFLCINFLGLLFSSPSLAGDSRCLLNKNWYTCDYVWSGKYMTVYRNDGKQFTIYSDAYKDYIIWYLTTGDNILGFKDYFHKYEFLL